jgi:hypothetical protein
MKVNEIKKTVEQVVRVEYIAEDGQVFYNEEECRKYEESALYAISKQLKKYDGYFSVYTLLDEGCDEEEVEIFDIQTDKDLENLQRYLYLKAIKNGGIERYVKDNITSTFNHVTSGHEVIIWWSYDNDCFYAYGDGSIEGYLSSLREKWTNLITPETKENE